MWLAPLDTGRFGGGPAPGDLVVEWLIWVRLMVWFGVVQGRCGMVWCGVVVCVVVVCGVV